jgi:hypothetical protein
MKLMSLPIKNKERKIKKEERELRELFIVTRMKASKLLILLEL